MTAYFKSPASQATQSFTPFRHRLLQRKCACGGTPESGGACKECSQKRLQRKAATAQSAPKSNGAAPPIVHEVLRSPGQPLDAATRAFMEPRFGHDFGQVRVHHDAKAAESARAVNAVAYAHGEHICFVRGAYQPGLDSGRGLLAHELAHTVQQGGHASPTSLLRIEEPDSAPEREADAAAQAIGKGGFYSPRISHGLTIARQLATPAPAAGVTPPSPPPPTTAPPKSSEADSVEAGLIALAVTLQKIGKAVEPFRTMYKKGEKAIAAKIAEMKAAHAAESEIAETASGMRKQIALQVREASGAFQQKAAELFDLVRGNVERPSYQSLRAAGKTDAAIIESATRTNKFVNALPSGLKWTGRAMWFISAGVSLYVVIEAPPEKRLETAEQEAGGLLGGALGSGAAEAACIIIGIATEGIGLLACGLLGGLVGFEAGRNLPSGLDAVTKARTATHDACESLPWWAKGMCYLGATGGSPLGL